MTGTPAAQGFDAETAIVTDRRIHAVSAGRPAIPETVDVDLGSPATCLALVLVCITLALFRTAMVVDRVVPRCKARPAAGADFKCPAALHGPGRQTALPPVDHLAPAGHVVDEMRGAFYLGTGLVTECPQPLSRSMVLVDQRIDLECVRLPGAESVQRPADVLDQLAEMRFVIRRYTIPCSLSLRLRRHPDNATAHRPEPGPAFELDGLALTLCAPGGGQACSRFSEPPPNRAVAGGRLRRAARRPEAERIQRPAEVGRHDRQRRHSVQHGDK